MRILMISGDRSLADPTSQSAQRNARYAEGRELFVLVLATGTAQEIQLAPNVRVHLIGGSSRLACLLRGKWMMRSVVRSFAPDVITSQDSLWCGLLASAASCFSRAAIHVQDHSAFFSRTTYSVVEKIFLPWSRRFVRHADRVRTVSQRGAEGLKQVGVSADRIDVIPIATDLVRFYSIAPSAGSKHVLCIARLEPEKSVDVLLRAWSKIVASVPSAELRIVGDGSQRKILEKLATDLKIFSSVTFAGSGKDIPTDLAWSDLVVQSSQYEGWGLVVIEAAAAGRAIVMTDVGCAGEVIKDGVSGVIVPVGSGEALAGAVTALLNDDERMNRLAAGARDAVAGLLTLQQTDDRIRESWSRARRIPRLLAVFQAVNLDDPLVGYLHEWLEFASRQFSSITVLALRVGRYQLPPNVKVISMRPNGGTSRMEVVKNLLAYSWSLRGQYDAVFVRGDAVYVNLAGWLWRLLRKRIVFWYAHYRVSFEAIVANWIAHVTITSVKEAFNHPWVTPIEIGQGINAERFIGVERPEREDPTVRMLAFGRVMPSKHLEDLVKSFVASGAENQATMTFTGPRPDLAYRDLVDATMKGHPSITWGDERVSYDRVPEYLSRFDVLVNAYPASLDKAIIESMMMGLIPIVATRGVLRGLPERLHWILAVDDASRISAIRRVLSMPPEERKKIQDELRTFAISTHSIHNQVTRIFSLIA